MSNSTVLTPQQKFEEKVKDRLRDSIGDLMPDEILSTMIEKATQEVFFKPRTVHEGYNTKTLPSWFEEEIKTQMQHKVSDAVAEVIKKNSEVINEQVKDLIVNKAPELFVSAIVGCVASVSSSVASQGHYSLVDQIRTALSAKGIHI